MTRIAVFIDYQNTYKLARGAFGLDRHQFTEGQIYPRRLAVLLCDRGRDGDPHRELEFVRVFRGEPSSKHSPKGQAACQRQVRFWDAQARVTAVTRPIKYYPIAWDQHGTPSDWEPKEKGIDVLIAVQMVMGALNDEFDVAILMSADTDLIPALEAVRAVGKRVEVAAWNGPYRHSRLSLTERNVWCHWLDRADYGRLQDSTDYTQPQALPPTANP